MKKMGIAVLLVLAMSIATGCGVKKHIVTDNFSVFYDDNPYSYETEVLMVYFLTPEGKAVQERVREVLFDLEDGAKTYLEVKSYDGVYSIKVHEPKSKFDPNDTYGLLIRKKEEK